MKRQWLRNVFKTTKSDSEHRLVSSNVGFPRRLTRCGQVGNQRNVGAHNEIDTRYRDDFIIFCEASFNPLLSFTGVLLGVENAVVSQVVSNIVKYIR